MIELALMFLVPLLPVVAYLFGYFELGCGSATSRKGDLDRLLLRKGCLVALDGGPSCPG
jgi:hypothetical protein